MFMETLNSFNPVSVTVRFLLAMAAGGLIGYGRSRKERSAGFRTYMLISVGAALVLIAEGLFGIIGTRIPTAKFSRSNSNIPRKLLSIML